MSRSPRILALAGSLRRGSYNKQLVRIAADAARRAGGEVSYIDLRDDPLPLFDEDLEKAEGMPASAVRLKQLMSEQDGFLLACPEYNSSITAALKNLIDWVSRSTPGDKPGALPAFRGKVATLMAASPGALGGLRGLVHVRAILGNLGVIVLPEQLAIAKAHEAFDEQGRLRDAGQQAHIERLGSGLVAIARKLIAE